MMLVKCHAICLRFYPFSNTSRIVQWLADEGSRIVTLVKGSQRARGGFLGQFDFFYTCELVFYARMNSAVQIARECSPLKPRTRLRSDWKACAAASYFCDAISRILPPQATHTHLFKFLDAALDAVTDHSAKPEFVFLFELHLLSLLGLAPRLRECARCRADLTLDAQNLFFSSSQGGVVCSTCRRVDDTTCRPISTPTWTALRSWQALEWPRQQIPPFPVAPTQWLEIEDTLGAFMAYHMDISLPSRAVALDVIRRPLPK